VFGVKTIDSQQDKKIMVPKRKAFKVVSEQEFEDFLFKSNTAFFEFK
jgi:hypothetical protein